MNLNAQTPMKHDMQNEWPEAPRWVSAPGVEVFFQDIAQKCQQYIEGADFVVGCVAWLTHRDILYSLAKRPCLLVVQKEDFLRPDINSNNQGLRQLYDQVKPIEWSAAYRGLDTIMYLPELNRHDCSKPQAIRCMGNYNRDKNPAFPRMHHKFLIFGKKIRKVMQNEDGTTTRYDQYVPACVWTGSFNLTYNATHSRENVVVIHDPTIVMSYYREFCNIFAMSEELDWTSDWIAPTYRIGT